MSIVTINRRRYYLTASGLQPLMPGTNLPLDPQALPDPEKMAAAEAKAEEKEARTEQDEIAEEMSRIAERLRNFGRPRKNRR